MKILLINHYAGSSVHGMEYRPYYLAREWVELGHSVTVVGASYSHLRSKQPETNGRVTRTKLDGIDYLWLSTPEYQGNGVMRALNIAAFISNIYRYRRSILSEKPDLVIASSTFPFDIFPARSIARAAKSKLIFEVHDLMPLHPIEIGGMPAWHPFIISMQIAENYAYKKADVIVSLLPTAAGHMIEHGMVPEKFVHIPNGVDVADWTNDVPLPEPHCSRLGGLKDEGRFIVGYTGSHGPANALDSLIEAAARVAKEPISFVLVGQGPEKESLKRLAHEKKLTNIQFLPAVPKASMPGILSMMDVLYIGLKSKPLFRFGVSPNKLMDYRMAGKPVIYAIDAGNDPVTESGCGITIPPEDPEAIADAIISLMEMKAGQRKMMGERGRNYVIANHDYRVLANRFLEICNSH